jgi:hypothetical protein
MRRIAAFLAALALVASVAGSSLAADPAPRSSFHGDFDLLAEDGTLLGHANAQLFQPTDQRLVPGRFDFMGAAGNPILESHAVIGNAHFWYDPGHLPNGATIPGAHVARGEGVECVYLGPNQTDCHGWAVQFVDNVDPSVRDEAMFFGSWGVATQFVGNGGFVLRFSGTES